MTLSSPAFDHNAAIPKKYSCEGENINPPLHIENIPENAKSLALIVDDPDAPNGTFVHWVVYNIPVVETIAENTVPGNQGSNDFKKRAYGGPCPPSGQHRYFFKLYALDEEPVLEDGSKAELEKAMQGHILQEAELVGLYEKQQ